MRSKIPVCARIGLASGFFASLLTFAYGQQPFLSRVGTPLPVCTTSGILPSLIGGLIVGLIFAPISAWLHVLLFRYPTSPLIILAVIVAFPVGLIAGLMSYLIANVWLATISGSISGLILGWLICWLLCDRKKNIKLLNKWR